MQIGRGGLRAREGADAQCRCTFAALKRRAPFAVTGVEHQNALTGFESQHGGQIMGLAAVQRSGAALLKRRINVKSRGAKIVTGHGRMLFLCGAFASSDASATRVAHAKAKWLQLELPIAR